MDLFPRLSPAEIERRTLENWDFSGVLPVPRPNIRPYCPACSNRSWQARFWNFHDRGPNHRQRYRCDLNWKCAHCGYIIMFGVVVPEFYWRRQGITPRLIWWRDAQRMIEASMETSNDSGSDLG